MGLLLFRSTQGLTHTAAFEGVCHRTMIGRQWGLGGSHMAGIRNCHYSPHDACRISMACHRLDRCQGISRIDIGPKNGWTTAGSGQKPLGPESGNTACLYEGSEAVRRSACFSYIKSTSHGLSDLHLVGRMEESWHLQRDISRNKEQVVRE